MTVKFTHSNLVSIIKDPYIGQIGYVTQFYPKQYYVKTDSCKTPIYYLNIHTSKVNFDKFKSDNMMDVDMEMDVKFNVKRIIPIKISDIEKVGDPVVYRPELSRDTEDYVIIKEGHPHFGDIGTLITKYEDAPSIDKIVLNEQLVKKEGKDPLLNDRVQLKKIPGCKTGTVFKIKSSQIEVELINGYKKVFDVKDIFYQDIELKDNKFVQVNYIKNDVIYGNYVNGEQVKLKLNDKSIKYKNVNISQTEEPSEEEPSEEEPSEEEQSEEEPSEEEPSEEFEESEDGNESDMYDYSYQQLENEQEQPEFKGSFKDTSHTEYTKTTMTKDDSETLDKIKRFIEVVKKKNECVININEYSIIETYNTILSSLKDYLVKINSSFKNKNNLFDNSIILYLVIAYNSLQLNGIDVCCIYNNYPGQSGIDKYINFLIKHISFNSMFAKVSKFNTKNIQTIFTDMKMKSKNGDEIANCIINCDYVLRHILNVGFSNLQELPVKCVEKGSLHESIPLKPLYNLRVPGYIVSDKKLEDSDKKSKINYTEQEIDEYLKEARLKNYKEAQKHWQKLKDDLIKSKSTKQKISSYYEYKVEYTTLDELIHETREYLESKIKNAEKQHNLINVEGYKFIYNNLLDYNLQISKENAKFIKLLKKFQQELKDNYKAIYTKRLLTQNYNKLKELKLTKIQYNELLPFLNNKKYTHNVIYNKYKMWFNTFLIINPQDQEHPQINIKAFDTYFNILIKKAAESQNALRKEEELSDILNQLTINSSTDSNIESETETESETEPEIESELDIDSETESESEEVLHNKQNKLQKPKNKLQKLREKFKSDKISKDNAMDIDTDDTDDSQFDLKYLKKNNY